MLREFDPESLTYEQRIEHGSFDWYLNDHVKRRPFVYHPGFYGFEVNPALQLQYTLLEHHVIEDIGSAEAYIDRLNQVDDQFACMRRNLRAIARESLLPNYSRLTVYDDFLPHLTSPGEAELVQYYTRFKASLDSIEGLSDEDKNQLLADAEDAIETSVIPAHVYLHVLVESLLDQTFALPGLWFYADGAAYYDYLLERYVGEETSANELHEFGLAEVARIRGEMDVIFETLGYPAGETLVELYDRVETDSGYIPANGVVSAFESIITGAESNLNVAFDIMPETELVVEDAGYFGNELSTDVNSPSIFYVDGSSDAPRYQMDTVAYHHTIPGHHFQSSIAYEKPVPAYRTLRWFGYFEGWALYTERLASELGWYENDPYADLGRLQWEMLGAVRVVADTGLESLGWGKEQVVAYISENVGLDDDDDFVVSIESQYQQLADMPATVPGFHRGMSKILELRQKAMDALGDSFDLKTFHRQILLAGEVPFETLEYVVQHYIDSGGKSQKPEVRQ